MRRAIVILLALPLAGLGQTLRGTANLSYQDLSEEFGSAGDTVLVINDALSQEQVNIAYDDLLWANSLRLSANFTRREFPQFDYHEFRPIFYADLRGYPYTWTSSYSPYKRQVTDITLTNVFYQHYRDWRTSFQLSYPGYPAAGMTYSRNKSFRSDDTLKLTDVSTNLVMQSAYQWRTLSFQASYNALDNDRADVAAVDNFTRTFSGSVGYNSTQSRLGALSSMYSAYTSRRANDGSLATRSETHSFSSMYMAPVVKHFSGTAAYSVRYTNGEFGFRTNESSNQSLSGQISYTPRPYLSLDATKNYQITDEGLGYQITEYVSIAGTASRYLRRGIDTRLTYNKTIFQQSDRADLSDGGDGSAASRGDDYVLDTYYGSIGGKLYRHVRMLVDGTITHNSKPGREAERYQMRGSLDFRARLSASMEGRFSYTGQYQGPELKLGRVYAQSYNTGLTYAPRSNININVTYIYNRFNSGSASGDTAIARLRQTNANFTGYVSYSFRRAFTVYLSLNRQRQDRREELTGPVPSTSLLATTESGNRPEVLNIQGVFYLTRKITTTVGYVRQDTDRTEGLRLSESIQSVVNIQL